MLSIQNKMVPAAPQRCLTAVPLAAPCSCGLRSRPARRGNLQVVAVGWVRPASRANPEGAVAVQTRRLVAV